MSHIKYKSYKKLYIYIYIYKYYANKLLKTTKFSNKHLFEKLHFRPLLLKVVWNFFLVKVLFSSMNFTKGLIFISNSDTLFG